jgi:hypothetical protein
MTAADISTSLEGYEDHAVLGLADPKHGVAILSTARLPKKHRLKAWQATVLHEWLHLWGYPHCEDPRCVMRDRHRLASSQHKTPAPSEAFQGVKKKPLRPSLEVWPMQLCTHCAQKRLLPQLAPSSTSCEIFSSPCP